MYSAKLRNGIVAVLEKHSVVELFGALEPDARVEAEIARDVEITDELIEKEASQALI